MVSAFAMPTLPLVCNEGYMVSAFAMPKHIPGLALQADSYDKK